MLIQIKNTIIKYTSVALLKTVTWRAVATVDTFILATLFTKHPEGASVMASIELVLKMIMYYVHERFWIKLTGVKQSLRISGIKSLSWRVLASTMTFLLGLAIFGDGAAALAISGAEFITKMALYFLHERAWVYLLVKTNNGTESITN